MYTYDIYVDWQENPTVTVVNTTSFPIKNVEFPAITICSQGLAKDIMENVLIKQFQSYLESKKVITKVNAKQNKREISDNSKQKKFESLTDEEVYNKTCYKEIYKDIYLTGMYLSRIQFSFSYVIAEKIFQSVST